MTEEFPYTEGLKAAEKALYEKVDAFSDAQLGVLVEQSLVQAHGLLNAETDNPILAASQAALADSFVAFAGAANARLQDRLGNTITGDKQVTEVIAGLHSLVGEALMTHLGIPEEILIEVKSGNQQALIDYVKTHNPDGSISLPGPAGEDKPKKDEVFGLYL